MYSEGEFSVEVLKSSMSVKESSILVSSSSMTGGACNGESLWVGRERGSKIALQWSFQDPLRREQSLCLDSRPSRRGPPP